MNKLLARFDLLRDPLAWLALLRLALGLMFLTTWASNLAKGLYTPDGLWVFFTQVFPQSENPFRWYAAFIENVILPARGIFAPFQLAAEGLMGLALLAGAFTPVFCLASIFFLANTFLATFGHDWPWAYLLPIAMSCACLFTRAGRRWGVDGLLRARLGEPRWPWW